MLEPVMLRGYVLLTQERGILALEGGPGPKEHWVHMETKGRS